MSATAAINAIVASEQRRAEVLFALQAYIHSLQTAHDEGEGERLCLLDALDMAKDCLADLRALSVQRDLDEALVRQESEELAAPMRGLAA